MNIISFSKGKGCCSEVRGYNYYDKSWDDFKRIYSKLNIPEVFVISIQELWKSFTSLPFLHN